MAKMVPTLTDPQLDRLREKSTAEAKFYLACRDQLGPEILVISFNSVDKFFVRHPDQEMVKRISQFLIQMGVLL